MTHKKTKNPRVNLATGAAVAFAVLLLGGIGQRRVESLLVAADAVPIALKERLSSLPLELGTWKGTEIPMEKQVIQIAGCDDYVSRRYIQEDTGKVVDLYASYAARPAKMLSHRPERCYQTHGWVHGGTHKTHLDVPVGESFDCLIHQFSKDDTGPRSVVVLNYYILRGRYATEWTEFWGPKWRLPNLSRDPNFYVAQVQISTFMGNSTNKPGKQEDAEALVKEFAAELAPLVRNLLPAAPPE